jgi:Transglutaminase-like superfamily
MSLLIPSRPNCDMLCSQTSSFQVPPASPRNACGYLLPFHIHFCLVADGAIFLDLRRDKYFAIGSTQTCALLALAADYAPVDRTSDSVDPSRCGAPGAEIGDALFKMGLLTRRSTEGRPISPELLSPADEELWPFDGRGSSPIRFAEVWRFVRAYLRVSISMRFGGLEHLRRRIAQRKTKAPQSSSQPWLEKTRRLLVVYQTLQALSFTAKHACLFDSLLLIEFLALHDVYATWMVGVRTDPFASHSWVQQETYILNGTKQYVQRFTPILAV